MSDYFDILVSGAGSGVVNEQLELTIAPFGLGWMKQSEESMVQLTNMDGAWVLMGNTLGGIFIYQSHDQVATPDLITNWEIPETFEGDPNSAVEPMPTLTKVPSQMIKVDGAGSEGVNGVYVKQKQNTLNYDPDRLYIKFDEGGKNYYLGFNVDLNAWIILNAQDQITLYQGTGETPDTAVWEVASGLAPVPTVTVWSEEPEPPEPKPASPPNFQTFKIGRKR